MDDSILNTIKKMLGISSDYTAFDTDIIFDINSVFLSLNQLGIGPVSIFSITDASSNWADFSNISKNIIVTYVYLKVRLLFDPPSSSFVLNSISDQIKELEFRLNALVEN